MCQTSYDPPVSHAVFLKLSASCDADFGRGRTIAEYSAASTEGHAYPGFERAEGPARESSAKPPVAAAVAAGITPCKVRLTIA